MAFHENESVEDGIGPDTTSEEVDAVEDTDERDNRPTPPAVSFEPASTSLVCRNNVNTLVVRLKSYPWFSV